MNPVSVTEGIDLTPCPLSLKERGPKKIRGLRPLLPTPL